MPDDIFEPTEEHRDPQDEEQMRMGKDDNALYDPWFPDAEAAEAFPSDQTIPEGQSYEDWKAGQS